MSSIEQEVKNMKLASKRRHESTQNHLKVMEIIANISDWSKGLTSEELRALSLASKYQTEMTQGAHRKV